MFSDHAVLQRDQPIRVWGKAAANAAVAIDLSGTAASAADAQGRWSAALPAVRGRTGPDPDGPGGRRAAGGLETWSWATSGCARAIEHGDIRCAGPWPAMARSPAPATRTSACCRPARSASRRRRRPAGRRRLEGRHAHDRGRVQRRLLLPGQGPAQDPGVPIGLIDATWGSSVIQDWISRED
ncbi:hypothetical protein ACRAWD_31400 [Caulobacter segnis]